LRLFLWGKYTLTVINHQHMKIAGSNTTIQYFVMLLLLRIKNV